jgi:hypothetical protein
MGSAARSATACGPTWTSAMRMGLSDEEAEHQKCQNDTKRQTYGNHTAHRFILGGQKRNFPSSFDHHACAHVVLRSKHAFANCLNQAGQGR